MIILGIDPGYDRVGIAVITLEKGKPSYLFSTCLETNKKTSLSKRLVEVGTALKEVIETWKPNLLAIETLYMTNNQKTAIGVAEARGIICYESEKAGLSLVEMTPLQIKQAVTGYGKADKGALFDMTKRLIAIPRKEGNKKMLDDEMDAIAIALAGSAYGVRGNKLAEKL